ncbi:hypothetical protein MVEN_00334800 [Mycena venus]|uniref:Ricin B lectin domain-containing protein n=1 Tax=Mycena venus TaxID=2733690 RepID=A0A8H6YP18_9AGAR|nr:hypothetical protein MVEN_00334800 [Mycena venus]
MFLRNVASILSVSASLALYANAQLAGQTVQLTTVLTASGNCLTAASNTDGAAVTIAACGNATSLNSWVLPQGAGAVGTIRIFGDKCLDVTNGMNVDGTKLQIWTCASGNTNQLWLPAGQDNTITWAGKNKCVDLTNGNVVDGNQIQIWDCDAQNDNQKWNHVALTQPKSFSISLKKNPSLCVAGSSSTAGAPVVIDTCNPGSTTQTFTDPKNNSNGLMMMFGMCVSLNSNVPSSGDKLVLAPCITNNSTQEWNHENEVLVKNLALPHLCLDLTDGNTTPGNQLQVWDCSSEASTGAFENTNQEWVVNNTF